MEHALNPKEIRYIFDDFVLSRDMDVTLVLGRSPYPWGYDPKRKTVTVDHVALSATPDWAGILIVLYSLTRVWLTLYPQKAPRRAQPSVRYDLNEDGRAYRLDEDGWRGCRLSLSPSVASRAAKSLPAHEWAVEYAMGEAEEMMSDENEKDNLHRFAYMLKTGDPMRAEEIERLLNTIDRALDA